VALRFENKFVVAAPLEATWKTLPDLERLARCLPGATIEPPSEDGSSAGSMRVKLGAVTMDFRGVARVAEIDEQAHVAVFTVQGKEIHGQGSASATIRTALATEADATRVVVETDLSVTGRAAQFGRGIMQDVAGSILTDFAKCLSEMMTAETPTTSPTAVAPAPSAVARPERDALDLGGALSSVLQRRLAKWTGLAALKRFFSRIAQRGGPA
jgi:hypothetical protein